MDSNLLKLLFPVAVCHALGHVTSNVSFAAVAVSFTHTIKGDNEIIALTGFCLCVFEIIYLILASIRSKVFSIEIMFVCFSS